MAGERFGGQIYAEDTDRRAMTAYTTTSRYQISRDLIEEMIALGKWPLSVRTQFKDVAVRGGYRGPELDMEKAPGFGSDEDYVLEVERLANWILGRYGTREHKFALSRLGGPVRLNRAFDAMKLSIRFALIRKRAGLRRRVLPKILARRPKPRRPVAEGAREAEVGGEDAA